jgi:DNA-directed RNA polymerase specialized sigma subunit
MIAARLGVSEPRISQLHARAMGRLRSTLAEHHAAEAA